MYLSAFGNLYLVSRFDGWNEAMGCPLWSMIHQFSKSDCLTIKRMNFVHENIFRPDSYLVNPWSYYVRPSLFISIREILRSKMGLKTKELYHKNQPIGFKVMMSTMGDESPFLGKRVKRSKMSKWKKNYFSTHIFNISSCVLCHHHIFSCISHFLGIRVRQKYVMWVLVGCRIEFPIQRVLPIEIWVNTQGDMSKIRVEKVVFFSPKVDEVHANIILLFPLLFYNFP